MNSLAVSEKLNLSLSPFQNGGGGLPSNHRLAPLTASSHPEASQEPTESPFSRTKDAPANQAILKDLGSLCQEHMERISWHPYLQRL
jgi:hypothetical protein